MSTQQLKIQKDLKAKAIIQTDFNSFAMEDCEVFANHSDEEIIVLFQDKNNPATQIQISITKNVLEKEEKVKESAD